MINLTELHRSLRSDPLCAALEHISDDRVTNALASVQSNHPEITFENYGMNLNEAIVMAAAHRIAYGEMFKLGSQVAIAKGQSFQKHEGDWLDTTPYGHRLKELRIESPHIGAIAISPANDAYWY